MTAPPWHSFARAPLTPIAVAAVLGLCADRYLNLSADTGFAVAAAGLFGWAVGRTRGPTFAAACLWGAFAGLAAAHHHTHRHAHPADDIGRHARAEPAIARLRGVIEESPTVRRADRTDLFGPVVRMDRAVTTLSVTQLHDPDAGWTSASGRVRLTVERPITDSEPRLLDAVRVGDEIEVVGRLGVPRMPGNPGEWDYRASLLDQRIRADLRVTKAAAAVTRLDDDGRSTVVLARLRGKLTHLLDDAFPPREAALARALLLGDAAALDRDEWDAFARTGVIHVLAISGQHLVVLAGFVWVTVRLLGVRRRAGAVLVLGLVVGYAALTGLRPSAVRAAVMVAVVCGGLLARRSVHAANAFALAALLVTALVPTDPFTIGCQLSFLAVFVLIWGVAPALTPHPTPLDRLIDESRPTWLRAVRAVMRWVLVGYAVSAALTLVSAPLVMSRQNLVPPIGVLVGPPLVLLTAAALLAGFLFLLVALLSPTLGTPLAVVCRWALSRCDDIVRWADALPGGSVYVPDPPGWWVLGFYAVLTAAVLTADRRLLLALLAWTAGGLIGLPRSATDELRVTVRAVGHGACAVAECPDGRVLVFDAGSMGGPDMVRRTVAPFLWHRGIRRIDELFLSHADADHFNGAGVLLARFPVGRATLNPSFASKPTAEVAGVLLALKRHAVEVRTAHAGQRFAAGAVVIDVLHPPPDGPPGSENERSLVLKLSHAGHTLLFTGDLEKAGTAVLLDRPPSPTDVLLAPHHGSRAALPAELVRWAAPGLVVASRGTIGSPVTAAEVGVPVWDTSAVGAVTLRSNPTGLTAEAFRTGDRRVVVRGGR